MNENMKPFSILFIEDEREIRENYVSTLRRYFKSVYEADNGEDGYKVYKDKKPEILIIDINMPKMNGLDMLRKVREDDHTTKVIMLTAHSDVSYLLDAMDLKLTKYLVKPITRAELNDALSLVISEIERFDVSSRDILHLKENFIWNYNTEELSSDSKIISLTQKERQILEYLFNNVNKIVTFDELILYVWDSFETDKLNTLKTTIMNLRKKLPKNTIQNIYGIGYKIE